MSTGERMLIACPTIDACGCQAEINVFTVNLADRSRRLWVGNMRALRISVAAVRVAHPRADDLRNHVDRVHIDDIHFNPVKHGHVERVKAWPHVSFHRCVRDGVLSVNGCDESDLASDGLTTGPAQATALM